MDFIVRLKRPNGFMNPGGRDYEASLFQQGINATGYIKKGEKLQQILSQFCRGFICGVGIFTVS